MKYFLFLLSAVCASAQIVISANPFGNFGGGVGYFFSERFEGTGYDGSNANGWTESGTGTRDEDYATSPAPLEGSQSLRIVAAGQAPLTTSANFSSDKSELWYFFKLNIVSYPTAEKRVIHLKDTTGTVVCDFSVGTAGAVKVYNNSAGSIFTVSTMALNTTYNVWVHFKKGTGADGIGSVGFSSGTTEVTSGNAYGQTLVGTTTTDFRSISIGFTATSTAEFIIDQLLVSSTGTVGNNPP